MSTILGFVSASIAVFLFLAAMQLGFYKLGHHHGAKDGFEKGYWQGRKHADNWWIGVEEQVDQARQKVWP